MATISFDGGNSFLDPLSPLNEYTIKMNLAHSRVWRKLVARMDPELRDRTLVLLNFPSPYLNLTQQRIQFLSTYLILSSEPLIITVTIRDLGILSSPQDGAFFPEPTDRDLYYYGLTREAWETGRESAQGPQIHPDAWYEERGLIPPTRHTKAIEEQREKFKYRGPGGGTDDNKTSTQDPPSKRKPE